MRLIDPLLGRRNFLVAFISSTIMLGFGRVAKAFDLLFQKCTASASEKPATGENKPLKAIVIYYSATGNTAKIAGAIYRGMKTVIDCDIAPIEKVHPQDMTKYEKINPQDMTKYDVIVLGSPIWFKRAPANVTLFANHMPRMDGKFCILFTTHGTQPIGVFWDIARNLVKKGITIIGWGDWYGDCSQMLHSAQPYVTKGHPDKIDLDEAELFGKEMAERAKKIAAGEKRLIPEVPLPEQNEELDLWSPPKRLHNIIFGDFVSDFNRPGGAPNHEMPRFDMAKCLYPRCTECMDHCPVNAIDHSMAAPAGLVAPSLVDKEPCQHCPSLTVTEGCQHCGGLCQRFCFNDAIFFIGEKPLHEIDMTKCIYPECTLCADECPMDAIDFSQNPPVIHNRCEGCDLCWSICPVEGASVITNLEKTHYLHIPTKFMPADIVKRYNLQDFQDSLETPWDMPPKIESLVKFRLLIPEEEIGKDGYAIFNPRSPRIVLKKEDWPYDVKG